MSLFRLISPYEMNADSGAKLHPVSATLWKVCAQICARLDTLIEQTVKPEVRITGQDEAKELERSLGPLRVSQGLCESSRSGRRVWHHCGRPAGHAGAHKCGTQTCKEEWWGPVPPPVEKPEAPTQPKRIRHYTAFDGDGTTIAKTVVTLSKEDVVKSLSLILQRASSEGLQGWDCSRNVWQALDALARGEMIE